LRALAVSEDLVVVVSAIYRTTCTLVRAGDEGFVIDSPVLPDELEALPALAEQASFPVSGLLATHGDWDHLLGRLAFPEASLGVGEPTLERLNREPGAAQRALRGFDDDHYVAGRAPLQLGGVQGLPVPGRLSLGPAAELELHPASGHTADGTAFWLPWLGALVCGDYLSPIEIPMISEGGSAAAYADSLARLAPLLSSADTVIPGHGGPHGRHEAERILEEDSTYLESLLRDGDAQLPDGRRSASQRQIHERNLASLAA
jgi:glyoxylase-like metal-dependent hydrolase (beta-lactamase superfamily II)